MKVELILLTSATVLIDSALANRYDDGPYNEPVYDTRGPNNTPYLNTNNNAPPPGPLGYSASVQQAKEQLKYFFARDKPIKASVDTLQDYYVDIDEKNMKNLHPRRKLRRPCKVLPDPQPGLVNPSLVEPVHRYRPLYRNEKFYGKFAHPISFNMQQEGPIVGSLPSMNQNYAKPNGFGPNPVYNPPMAYPVIQKETVYQPNPFYGYQRNENNPSDDYFQKIKPSRTRTYNRNHHHQITLQPTQTTFPSMTATAMPSSLSLKISSMSEALASNSAAMLSMSFSAKMASMSSVWEQKEASLKAKLSSMSITATPTTSRGWHW